MDSGNRRVSLRVVAGVATVLGIFSTFQAYSYLSRFTNREPSLPLLLVLNVTYWYAWAVLVPGMIWMARRYRFGRHTWPRALAMHSLGVVAFTFMHAVLTIAMRMPLQQYYTSPMGFAGSFRELFFLYFDWEMMTYWAVVGLSHALDFHNEAQERELTTAQLQTRLAEASLQSLQRQLHPHFLFNTLHTISALMHRDTEAADAMLAQLSDLLRLTLERVGTQEVALKEEVDFLEKYLEIEQTRFGERLQVRLNIDPDTLDAAVPNFLLQPLVENAVRHGIAQTIGGGRVEISARRDGDQLHLVVRDTGPGLSDAKLNALNTGVGLTNTRSRLQHLFGDRHSFEFQEPADGGLAVKIAIPFARDPESRPDADMESVA
jgi:signal transduction histidine kinase